ncbi:MAG: [Protein-PII] uridylyltransferase / [Protein-PII]-UMP uridylyl-removing enzyme, partial [uncultured Ramlibacter sp.]
GRRRGTARPAARAQVRSQCRAAGPGRDHPHHRHHAATPGPARRCRAGHPLDAGCIAAGLRAGGGRRLRPWRAVSALRRRRAGAHARRHRDRPRRGTQAAHRILHRPVLGHRAGDRLERAHGGRVRGPGPGRRHGADLAAGVAPAGGRRHPVRQLRAARAGHAGPTCLFCGQDAGDAPAPHQVREHAVRAGAQLQGVARRPARFAGHPLGGQGRGPGQQLGGPGRQRAGHAAGGAADPAQRSAAEPDPRPLARRGQPARGPAGVRPADRRGRVLWLSPPHGGERPHPAARQRRADETLLLGRQGGDPAQPDPAAEHRGAAEPQRARAGADQRALLEQGGHAGGGPRGPVPARAARHPRDLPAVPDHRRHQGAG